MDEGLNQREPRKWTKEEAEAEVQFILQEIYRFGNNDREYSDIKNILTNLREGKYSPQRAVDEARAVFESKNQNNF